MANRMFKMQQIRPVIVRIRLGESDCAGFPYRPHGPQESGHDQGVSSEARPAGCGHPLPDETGLAQIFADPHGPPSKSSSMIDRHQEEVTRWWREGLQGTIIRAALVRKYGLAGSFALVWRFGLAPLLSPHDKELHDLAAERYRVFRGKAFHAWQQVTYA